MTGTRQREHHETRTNQTVTPCWFVLRMLESAVAGKLTNRQHQQQPAAAPFTQPSRSRNRRARTKKTLQSFKTTHVRAIHEATNCHSTHRTTSLLPQRTQFTPEPGRNKNMSYHPLVWLSVRPPALYQTHRRPSIYGVSPGKLYVLLLLLLPEAAGLPPIGSSVPDMRKEPRAPQ